MRATVEQTIPLLKSQVTGIAEEQCIVKIAPLWQEWQIRLINTAIEEHIHGKWQFPNFNLFGLAKIIREGGIPRNGAYVGRNWNAELLGEMRKYIDKWKWRMMPQAKQLAESICKPVKEFGPVCRRLVQNINVSAMLKTGALETVRDTITRIDILSTELQEKLEEQLTENHLHFTMEIDIQSPVAAIMRPIYVYTANPLVTDSGVGVYKRMLRAINDTLQHPPKPHPEIPDSELIKSLVPTLYEKIIARQRMLWSNTCQKYIDDFDTLLWSLYVLLGHLLATKSYLTYSHTQARKGVEKALNTFETRLEGLKERFVDDAKQQPEKRARLNEILVQLWHCNRISESSPRGENYE